MAEASSHSLFDLWSKLQGVVSSAASSSCPFPVPNLIQLHEMVYEVYSPLPEEKPELEIVFFHGLKLKDCKEAHITTWMSEDNSEMWPKTWLVEAFPKARIITISYDSAAKKTTEVGRLDMYLTGENLLSAVTSESVRVGEAQCPIVLIGHCLGGLLLKELCIHTNKILSEKREEIPGMQRIHHFFHNLRGMFFYGTPHLGSVLGDKLHDCFSGSLLDEIEILNAWSARKNGSFCDLKARYNWLTYGMGESQETFVDCLGRYIHVVPEASSRANMDMYYSVSTNHINLCKPNGKQASAFSFLTDFLHKIHGEYILRSGVDADAITGRGYVVDYHGRANRVKSMLAEPNTHTTFIVGLAGIGKTTLAKQVFHDISHTFAIRCFVYLDNFQQSSSIREEVLRKIKSALKPQVKGWNYDHSDVPHYLKGKNVLIILDNVQSQSQLDALDRRIWLEDSNSRLLVTTNDSRLGSLSNTYKVNFLRDDESRELFCHHAFENRARPAGLADGLEQVISRCGNYPLSLEILGRYLSAEDVNDQNLWNDLLVKLEDAEEVASGPDYSLWRRLRPCYDALAASEQELFLDVAVVFCGLPLNYVEIIWRACRLSPTVGWRNLKRGFLIDVQPPDGTIRMREVLTNLGRGIACPKTSSSSSVDKWRRIYGGTLERNFIANYLGMMETLSLELQVRENERLMLRNTTFAQYVKLEYLIMDGVDMTDGSVELPRSLVYLKWKGAIFEACPVDFNRLQNLVVLDLQYCKAMKRLPSSVVIAKKLKWLELRGCQSLIELPEGVYEFSDLEYLGLSMTGMTEISRKVGKLKKLRIFQANQTKLARLPGSVGHLGMLTSLNISNTDVSVLPPSVGRLGMLRYLNISNTDVSILPPSVTRLGLLHFLNISDTAVRLLPESIGDLDHLTGLFAQNTLLSSLPDSIGRLQKLTHLDLSHTRMKRLPQSLGNAVKLLSLELSSTPLEALPDSLCKLRSLYGLCLRDTHVSTLPDAFEELKNLGSLDLEGSRVRVVPETWKDMGRLMSFHFTMLSDGQHSEAGTRSTISNSHEDFGCSCNVEAKFYPRRNSVPSRRILFQRISEVAISGDGFKQSLLPTLLHTLKKMTSLRKLTLKSFNEVEILPSELGTLTGLSTLYIESCEKLWELPESLGSLLKLHSLALRDLPRLRRLPESLGIIKNLSWFEVINCGSLQSMSRSFGHASPSDRHSSTSSSDECVTSDSSPTLYDQLQQIKIRTDSWRVLRCLLECCSKGRSCKIEFVLECEEMERVCKSAVEWLEGPKYRKHKVATTVLRKLCMECQAGDDGLHGLFGPSTVWHPLNVLTKHKVATTVFRKLCMESQAGDDGLHILFGPSTVWHPLNVLTSSSISIYLECELWERCILSHGGIRLRVLDMGEDNDEDTEEDSVQDEGEEELWHDVCSVSHKRRRLLDVEEGGDKDTEDSEQDEGEEDSG